MMGTALKALNRFHAKLRSKKNGELRVLLADKFGVTWEEVLIVLRHLDSWTLVSEQRRLSVDVQDWLVTDKIVRRMYAEIESWRELAKRRAIRCNEEGHTFRTKTNRCKWCGTRKG